MVWGKGNTIQPPPIPFFCLFLYQTRKLEVVHFPTLKILVVAVTITSHHILNRKCSIELGPTHRDVCLFSFIHLLVTIRDHERSLLQCYTDTFYLYYHMWLFLMLYWYLIETRWKHICTLNSTSKYTLCYLTSTQKKWSLEIQNWLGLIRIEVLHKRPTSQGILGTPKIHLRSATLWVLNKSKSVYFLLELSVHGASEKLHEEINREICWLYLSDVVSSELIKSIRNEYGDYRLV